MDLVQLKTALCAISPGQLELIFGEARDEKRWRDIRTLPEFREIMMEIEERTAGYLEAPLKTLPY